jgi:catechol 2,3-dioxygenase-like lactoylglutathione lyase family enzyme
VIPPVAGILETCLYAPDLDAAEGFYGGLLGLRRHVRVGDRHVFYRCGGQMLLVFNPAETEVADPDATIPVPVHGARGPGHVCFRSGDLDGVRSGLEAAGLPIDADFRWPTGARSVYTRDPAGNSVEFAEPALWGL